MNSAHVAIAAIAAVLFSCGSARVQFADNFDGPAVDKAWAFFAGDGMRDFGGVRVTEILGGDPAWDQKSVTLETLTGGKPLDEVINPQMIIDVEVAEDTLPVERGSKVLVTISRPVLQRLLDGRTNGIALKPLGAILRVITVGYLSPDFHRWTDSKRTRLQCPQAHFPQRTHRQCHIAFCL